LKKLLSETNLSLKRLVESKLSVENSYTNNPARPNVLQSEGGLNIAGNHDRSDLCNSSQKQQPKSLSKWKPTSRIALNKLEENSTIKPFEGYARLLLTNREEFEKSLDRLNNPNLKSKFLSWLDREKPTNIKQYGRSVGKSPDGIGDAYIVRAKIRQDFSEPQIRAVFTAFIYDLSITDTVILIFEDLGEKYDMQNKWKIDESIVSEAISDNDFKLLKNELNAAGGRGKFSDKDINKILEYLDRTGSLSTLLSPGILETFLKFGKEIGFPATLGAAQMALHTSTAKTETIIDALKAAKVLASYDLPGGVASATVSRNAIEDRTIKKNPEKEITVFDYDKDFVSELGIILGRIGLKGEGNDVKANLIETKEWLNSLLTERSEPETDREEDGFFHHLDLDAVDKFTDGMLLVLGELEAEGKIPKFKKASDAKSALMATIRKMYQSRSEIGKMARKYQRFGSERMLRTAKRGINRAQAER
jgi:hypothetical protein